MGHIKLMRHKISTISTGTFGQSSRFHSQLSQVQSLKGLGTPMMSLEKNRSSAPFNDSGTKCLLVREAELL